LPQRKGGGKMKCPKCDNNFFLFKTAFLTRNSYIECPRCGIKLKRKSSPLTLITMIISFIMYFFLDIKLIGYGIFNNLYIRKGILLSAAIIIIVIVDYLTIKFDLYSDKK